MTAAPYFSMMTLPGQSEMPRLPDRTAKYRWEIGGCSSSGPLGVVFPINSIGCERNGFISFHTEKFG